MPDDVTVSQRIAAQIAFRHVEELTEQEHEHVLVALIASLPQAESEVAERVLYHLQQQKRAQLTLKSILEGVK